MTNPGPMEEPPIRLVPPPQPIVERSRVYSAPRRFGITALLAITAAYAVLVWGLQLLNTPPPVTIAIGVFLAIVGGAQATSNRDPRLASQVGGVVSMLGWFVYFVVANELYGNCMTLCGFPVVIGCGAAAGYVGGVLVAGLFMAIENVGDYFRRDEAAKELENDSPVGQHHSPTRV